MKINLPNLISLLRIVISPFYFYLILSTDQLFQQLACVLFLIGALTDYIDGWYARKYNEITDLGKFVDPLADKILTSAAFLSFVFLYIIPWWMVAIIILRDFITTILRIYGEYSGKSFRTSKTAQVKTALQMLFITYILVLIYIKDANSNVTSSLNIQSLIYSSWTYTAMFLLTLMTVWTIIEYFYQNKELLNSLLKSIYKRIYVRD